MTDPQKDRIKLAWRLRQARRAMSNGDMRMAQVWMRHVFAVAPSSKILRYSRGIQRVGMRSVSMGR